MLARRSASDLTIMKPKSVLPEEDAGEGSSGAGTTRLKVRLPRAEVEKLLKESKDKGEAAEKIVGLYGLYMDKTTQSASKNAPKEEKEDGIKPREVRMPFTFFFFFFYLLLLLLLLLHFTLIKFIIHF